MEVVEVGNVIVYWVVDGLNAGLNVPTEEVKDLNVETVPFYYL